MKKYILFFVLVCISIPSVSSNEDEIDWNSQELNWKTYEEGLEIMDAENKKGILILYADWCPTCQAYSKFFKDKEIVEALDGLVLMKANVDTNNTVKKYIEYDESYVPKTIALNSKGELISSLYNKKEEYMFFLPIKNNRKTLIFIENVKKS